MPDGISSRTANEPGTDSEQSKPPAVRKIRILVADDHESVRRCICSLLSSQPGLVVCGEATNGAEAVERAKALSPDVVLMDITMPIMNGLEATRAIRDALLPTKVIVVSQNDPALVRRQAAAVCADGWVGKAELAQDLVATIERVTVASDKLQLHENEAWQHRNRLNLVAQATQVGFWFCDLPFDQLIWDNRVKEHFWLPPDAQVSIDDVL